jgi:glycerate-2-kinase
VTRARLRFYVRRILRAGLAAVEPGPLVRAHLHLEGDSLRIAGVAVKPRRLFVVSAGKAAIPMARAAISTLRNRLTEAIVIAPGKAPRLNRARCFTAGHPIPDAAGARAARHVIEMLEQAGRGDVVLLLLSGGASALMPAPVEGVSLRDKQRVTGILLRSGASIGEMNAVRKRLSRLKGGGFSRLAFPARVFTLAISDVPGDDPGTIGSGPTVEDATARAAALRAARKYLVNEALPPGVSRALLRPGSRERVAKRTRTRIIGSGRSFARAAAREAVALGMSTRVRPDALRGEARVCGPQLVAAFEALRGRGLSCLIATGETVVSVRGRGRGGRNQELALSSIEALSRCSRPTVLAAFATDGKDGSSGASGGLVDDTTARRARARGVSIPASLDDNDSTDALQRLGGLIVSGPTGTNVADVTIVVG